MDSPEQLSLPTGRSLQHRWPGPAHPSFPPRGDFKKELEKIRSHIPPGKIVKYSCHKEYTADQKPHVKCKWWFADQETAKVCGHPPAILFGETVGELKKNYQPGETMEYKCPNDYVLKGNKVIKCVENVWEEAPSCLGPCTTDEKDMDENNVELKWKKDKEIKSAFGETVEFSCKMGYDVPPGTQMRVVCDNNKLNIPKCIKAKQCVTTEKDMKTNNIRLRWKNDKLITSEHGQTTEFMCQPGYKAPPNTNMRIVCNQGNMDYPKCVKAK
ncbi:coagulation factor XIII B chain-like isoform X2 [Hyla sarda]|uniref:coagulation factor XIII B chain-like isoform X2 n=1 Tax=Hyla sarda TaxID=327740 RepID=UPI0024C33802|nr:coagulation factor XIII B chain-like isoform X2 [Hyla sarda]